MKEITTIIIKAIIDYRTIFFICAVMSVWDSEISAKELFALVYFGVCAILFHVDKQFEELKNHIDNEKQNI